MGVVYRAFDRQLRLEVALKTLRNLEPTALFRFKKEFRSLADLVHPNLVALHELRAIGNEWFFTMELIDGVPFLEYVRPYRALLESEPGEAPGRGSAHWTVDIGAQQVAFDGITESTLTSLGGAATLLDQRTSQAVREAKIRAQPRFDRVATTTLQLCEAVEALHAAKKLHRDIKPSNVLVDGQGRVVLLDFGLITDQSGADATSGGGTVGTPSYMSPEQAARDDVDEASDWYSVGVMIYEALSGRVPFSGRVADILHDKQHRTPVPVTAWSPDAPDALVRLCNRLLQRDPRRRGNGSDIRRLLGAEQHAPALALASSDSSTSDVFVGRDAELATLLDGLIRARRGGTATVFVEGLSGMGKSALVRRFVDKNCLPPECVVLHGRCYEREAVPYKALDAMVDSLSTFLFELDESLLSELLPEDVLSLARLFPVLRRIPAVAEPRTRNLEPPNPQESRRRGFAALTELLSNLAQRFTVVLSIDDLQWGDVDSASFLSDLIHDPSAPPLLLLGTFRREDRTTSECLQVLLAPPDSGVAGDVAILPLEPLDSRDARALLERVLGADASVGSLAREGAGHPMFLAELARARREGRGDGVASLQDVLAARLQALPDDARALITAAAIAGRPVPVDIASAAADLKDPAGALTVLRAERLLRTIGSDDDARIEPAHDQIRSVATAELTETAERRFHRRLARAFEAREHPDVLSLVEHWRLAGDVDKAGRYAHRAGEAAEKALAFRQAAHFFSLELELTELTNEARRPLLRRIGDAMTNAGQLEQASDIYLEAAREAPPDEAFDLRHRAVNQLLRAGQQDRGLELARAILDEVGMSIPSSPVRILLSIAVSRLWIKMRGLGFKERSLGELSERDANLLAVNWTMSSALAVVDPLLGTLFQMRHLRHALTIGEPNHVALALSLETGYRGLAGRPGMAEADKTARAARELGERTDDVHAIGMAVGCGGIAAFLAGRFREASARLTQGEQLLRGRCENATWEADVTTLFRLSALLYRGELADLARQVPRLLSDALESGDDYLARGLRGYRGNAAWLVLGDPDEAERQVDLADPKGKASSRFHLPDYYRMLSRGRIDLYRGGEDAWARLAPEWTRMESSLLNRIQSIRIEGQFLRGRCALADAAHHADLRNKRLGEASDAARKLEREKAPWARALALLVRAGISAARGDRDRAIERLSEAERSCDKADMAALATAARWRRGQLLGGDVGNTMLANAREWLQGQRVADPDAMVAMWAPGFFPVS